MMPNLPQEMNNVHALTVNRPGSDFKTRSIWGRAALDLEKVPAVLASLNARLPALCGGGAAASSLRALQIACLLVVLALVAGVLDFPDIIDDDTMLVQVPQVAAQHMHYAATMLSALPSRRSNSTTFDAFTMEDGEREWQPQIENEYRPFMEQLELMDMQKFVTRLQEEGWSAACSVRMVVLSQGVLYHDNRGLAKCRRPAKLQAFDKHLRSVVEYAIRVGTPLPDAIFVLSTSADGTTELAAPVPLREWGLLTKVPVLVIAKRRAADPGVRIPNMYFGSIASSWDRNTRTVMQIQKSRPWSSRQPRAFWRGNCGHLREASWPRVQLAALGVTHRGSVDAALTEPVHFPTDGLSPEEVDMVESLPVQPRINQLVLSTYKFLVNMPGSSTGSYSKNLQALWPHKSVVLMWENEATEWYYEKMKPGETHVPVNAENFIESLDRLKANDNEAQRVAAGGYRMFQRYLSKDSIMVYWNLVLREHMRRFRAPVEVPAGNEFCSCVRDKRVELLHPKCSFCEDWFQESTKSLKPLNSYLFLHGYTTKRKR